MTNFILLIGAGLFTKAVNAYQEHACVSFPFSHINAIRSGGYFPDSPSCLGQMPTTLVEPAQDRMTSEATCGIWIAAVPKALSMVRVGRYSTHFSDGPIMQQVRIVIRRSSAEILTNFHFLQIVGSVLAYVFYWLAVVAVLVFMKFKEVSFAPVHLSLFRVLLPLPHRAARNSSVANQRRAYDDVKHKRLERLPTK
jgi:hypothetical protein